MPLTSDDGGTDFGVTSNGDGSCRTTIDMCFVQIKVRYAGELQVDNMTAGNQEPYLVSIEAFDHIASDNEETAPPKSLGVIYSSLLFPGDFEETSIPTQPGMAVELDIFITEWNQQTRRYESTGEHACDDSKTDDPCEVVP